MNKLLGGGGSGGNGAPPVIAPPTIAGSGEAEGTSWGEEVADDVPRIGGMGKKARMNK